MLKLSWNAPERCSATFLNAVLALLVNTAAFMGSVKNVAARCNFRAQNIPEYVCSWGFAPDPTGGAYSASQTT